MYFETADIIVAPWVPPLVAFGISFFTSMGGVSGAFLLLPFQMSFLGFTNPSVSSTNQLFNVVAIPGGCYRYIREGRMVWPLTWTVVCGTLPGVFAGAVIRIAYLPDPRNFKLFAALVLLFIGARLVRDLFRKIPPSADRALGEKQFPYNIQQDRKSFELSRGPEGGSFPAVRDAAFNRRRIRYQFNDEEFNVSIWKIFALSFAVGIVGGIYGIGGGAILAPFFVSFFNLPVYTVAGATLMGTFVTSIAGVAAYQAMAPFYPNLAVAPDWLLGFLFGLGGIGGMYMGARLQKYIPARSIKWLLAGILFYTSIIYILDFM